MIKNRKFCVVFLTKNYYSMFESCVYKYSKANWKDVLVLNVDISSNDDQLKNGRRICEKLGIEFVNSENDIYVSCQSAILAVDKYLTNNNIDVNWLVYFAHDVVPLQDDFWDRLDNAIDSIIGIDEKVGMFGPNTLLFANAAGETRGGGSYEYGLKMLNETDFNRRRNGTAIARGNLIKEILEPPYKGWYRFLPDEYHKVDYFVVEIPNWTMVAFNRKLYVDHIKIDVDFEFNLFADDIAYQFMLKGYLNISFTDLMCAHDLHFSKEIWASGISNIGYKRGPRSNVRFKEKYGWEFGYRNKRLREQFNLLFPRYEGTLFEKFFNMSISDGPKRIEDFE